MYVHRRIQDFVGGQGPLAPPPPGSAPDYCAAANYLATQINICEGLGGAKAPLPPPPGSAPDVCIYDLTLDSDLTRVGKKLRA